ncbi:MAG: DUF3108 domain-containing protein [Albidovulum sp.]|uniref:DUF3108 domain-containing protein n=1 Tax=Albidovulum sp. TaxID=1872424 RepID=UPI003C97EA1A
MTIASRRFCGPLLALMMGLTTAEADQTDSAVFDLTLKGIYAGTLSVSGAIKGQSYAASGVLKSGGLVALVKKVRYDARSRGSISDGRFRPALYEEDADTGKRQSQSVMEYSSGVPQVKKYNPPRKKKDRGVDPASQGGTLDPLTALYAALRDVPEDQACNLAVYMFDGKRRSQVVLGDPQPKDEGISCPGEYRRLEGFSKKEMKEKSRFPFTMHLEPAGDGMMRVVEVSMDTLYGNGSLKRR